MEFQLVVIFLLITEVVCNLQEDRPGNFLNHNIQGDHSHSHGHHHHPRGVNRHLSEPHHHHANHGESHDHHGHRDHPHDHQGHHGEPRDSHGHHGDAHPHHKCTKRSLGCSSRGEESFENLGEVLVSFGLAVLGKDQESADDRPPTEDHAHLLFNTQAIIDELFSPSSTHRPTTSSAPVRTVTESLPIKAHDIGRFSSPSDLVMSNHIAEPVFERKPRNFGATTEAPVYLTETHYYLDKNQSEEHQHFSPLTGARQGRQFDGNIQFSEHLNKPVIPVIDTRPFNFALINDVNVKDIIRKNKPKPKKVNKFDKEDTIFRNDFFDRFKNISTQDLIERNKHSSGRKVSSLTSIAHSKPRILSSTEGAHGEPRILSSKDGSHGKPRILSSAGRVHGKPTQFSGNNRHSKSEASVSRSKTNGNTHSQVPSREMLSIHRKLPSLHWEPPPKNLRVRANHKNLVRKQTRQNIVSEQGRNRGVTKKILEQSGQQRHSNSRKQVQNHRILANTVERHQQNLVGSRNTNNKRTKQSLTQAKQPIKSKSPTKGKQITSLIRKGRHRKNHQDFNEEDIDILQSTLDKVRQDITIQSKRQQSIRKNKKMDGDARNTAPKNIQQNQKNFERTFPKSKQKRLRRPKAFERQLMKHHSTKGTQEFQCEIGMKGVYADLTTSCERFFMCQPNGREEMFTCPRGTLFNQQHGVCDWAKKVNCSKLNI